MRKKSPLRKGDVVRLRKNDRGYVDGEKATVINRYSDVPGGVILDRSLDGFKSWNEDDLTVLRRV